MKIDAIKTNPISRKNFSLKQIFSNGRMKIKTLLADVFEKSPETERLVPRGLPNSVSAKYEKFSSGGGRKIKFYQEDLDKMNSMTIHEKIEYAEQLIENGRYYS